MLVVFGAKIERLMTVALVFCSVRARRGARNFWRQKLFNSHHSHTQKDFDKSMASPPLTLSHTHSLSLTILAPKTDQAAAAVRVAYISFLFGVDAQF